MRLPGIEPGYPRWQREVLAIGQQTQRFFCSCWRDTHTQGPDSFWQNDVFCAGVTLFWEPRKCSKKAPKGLMGQGEFELLITTTLGILPLKFEGLWPSFPPNQLRLRPHRKFPTQTREFHSKESIFDPQKHRFSTTQEKTKKDTKKAKKRQKSKVTNISRRFPCGHPP